MTVQRLITWLRMPRSVIGLKELRQFFNQWESKPIRIAPCTRDFSCALSELQLIARNCDWFVALPAPVVIALVLVLQQSFENCSIELISAILRQVNIILKSYSSDELPRITCTVYSFINVIGRAWPWNCLEKASGSQTNCEPGTFGSKKIWGIAKVKLFR